MVFISYAMRDRVEADGRPVPGNLVDEVCGALGEAGIPYWIDTDRLDMGSLFPERIANAISDCDTFLFLSSEAANSSDWTLREVSLASKLGKRILPLRLDHSAYNPGVAFLLAPVQYIDCLDLGREEALAKVVECLGSPPAGAAPVQDYRKLPKLTVVVLYAALGVLTAAYALLTYLFLWVRTFQDSEVVGGLMGLVAEYGILLSVYYVLRLLRRRKCYFVLPLLLAGGMLACGIVPWRLDLMVSSLLLLLGWMGIFMIGFYHTPGEVSLYRQMSRDDVLLRPGDPENFLLLYLLLKSVIVVVGHFADHFIDLQNLFMIYGR